MAVFRFAAVELAAFLAWETSSLPAAITWEEIDGGQVAHLQKALGRSPGFAKVETTGVSFTNALPPDRLLENQVRYGGCGVAAGDVDGDGLCDLFFCSLEGRSHLYRNLGHWKFEEITDQAGVALTGLMTSGAVLTDIDGDGDLDLLVNAYKAGTRLLLNDGQGHFSEKTDAGLQQRHTSTSLTLADVDGDGTLDLYVANYVTKSIADSPGLRFTIQRVRSHLMVTAVDGVPVASNPELQNKYIVDPHTGSVLQLGEADVFYLNKGKAHFEAQPWLGGRFQEASGEPLKEVPYDYGLSAMFRDLNGDGLPDLYVCNDFFTPDRLWLNQGKGVFRAASNFVLRHMCDSSMGLDVADVNGDGVDDMLVLDMLSREHKLRAVQVIGRHKEVCIPGRMDSCPPYNRNMLFLGRGDGTFAEVAYLAGLEASEWSWMPVFLDVDLDGFEDLLMTTGNFRDSLNMDLQIEFDRHVTGKHLTPAQRLQIRQQVYAPHRQPNVAFRNRGDLTFEDASDRWRFNELGIKQGMCLADLDNDGDLDVIVNNFGAPPSLYRNETTAGRVAVRLKGLAPNTEGIGSKIYFRGGPVLQTQEMICGGRYLSGDDAERVFATGASQGPFTIEVAWRSGLRSVLTNVQPNCLYEIDEAQAKPAAKSKAGRLPWFRDASNALGHRHQERPFNDFDRQPLLPRKLSQAGPGVSWGDLDGDGWPDLVIGGGRGGELALRLNDHKGGFVPAPAPAQLQNLPAEQGSILVLPEETRKQPLILVSQSNYEAPSSNSVFTLSGTGPSLRVTGGLPAAESCPGALIAADVDGDGQLDLFFAGRVIPGRYPVAASSCIYRRTSQGEFIKDAANSTAFDNVGLVNGAVFSDLDGDGWPDLVLALDWGPVRVFHNESGRFREITENLGLDKITGWWNSIAAGDFDGDGRMDLIAGNWGRNTRYQRYRGIPLAVYYGDWNDDGQLELLEAGQDPQTHKIVCFKELEPLRDALPWVAERFPTFAAFGEATVTDILGERLTKAGKLEATTLDSMLFLNRGDHFEARPLPLEAQFAPVFGICVADFDGDGAEDIFLAQNFYPVDPESSRYDAGRGLLLRGTGLGGFEPLPGQTSGIEVYGDQRGAAVSDYDQDGRIDVVVTQNGAATKLYHNEKAKPGVRVVLAGSNGNPAGFGAQLRLQYEGASGPAREVHAGSGYWSQDDSTQLLGKTSEPTGLWVRWPGGRSISYHLKSGTRQITVHPNGEAEEQ